MGNLKMRFDIEHEAQKESFIYDDLNRLTQINYTCNGGYQAPTTSSFTTYDATGNILSKTGVGADMQYGEVNEESNNMAGPHALTSVNIPMGYQPNEQDIDYTYFNKVSTIQQYDDMGVLHIYRYTYGADKQRRMTTYDVDTMRCRTKYYLGNYERVTDREGYKIEYHYLSADAGLFAIFVRVTVGDDVSTSLKYVLTDHLGSLTEVFDAETGESEQSLSYNAWGAPRIADDWTQQHDGNLFADRGFTGHEHLPAIFGLIDMNGRMYDPIIGRFLSPDPYVQIPEFPQNFNRYAFCLNNPLLYSDPSGEFFLEAMILGGFANLIGQAIQGNINSFGDFAMAFGVGMLSGAAGALAGAATISVLGGYGLAGTMSALSYGSVAASTVPGAFSGAAIGATSGFEGGFVGGAGNAWLNGASFGDGLSEGLKSGGIGLLVGGAVGGVTGGIQAKKSGLDFWDGDIPLEERLRIITERIPEEELRNGGVSEITMNRKLGSANGRTTRGDIYNISEDLQGYTNNTIELHPRTVRRIWNGKIEGYETLEHELFHAKDYHSDTFSKIWYGKGKENGQLVKNVMDYRAFYNSYQRTGLDIYRQLYQHHYNAYYMHLKTLGL